MYTQIRKAWDFTPQLRFLLVIPFRSFINFVQFSLYLFYYIYLLPLIVIVWSFLYFSISPTLPLLSLSAFILCVICVTRFYALADIHISIKRIYTLTWKIIDNNTTVTRLYCRITYMRTLLNTLQRFLNNNVF